MWINTIFNRPTSQSTGVEGVDNASVRKDLSIYVSFNLKEVGLQKKKSDIYNAIK